MYTILEDRENFPSLYQFLLPVVMMPYKTSHTQTDTAFSALSDAAFYSQLVQKFYSSPEPSFFARPARDFYGQLNRAFYGQTDESSIYGFDRDLYGPPPRAYHGQSDREYYSQVVEDFHTQLDKAFYADSRESLTDVEDNRPRLREKKYNPYESTEDLVKKPVKSSPKGEFTFPAVMTLIGSFFVMFCSVGFINAFGVFEEFYGTVYLPDKSASDISWLGSFNLFIMFGLTLPVGFLNDKFGPEMLMKVGSVITLLSLFLASLCKSYATLFLTQGFLFGLGCAITILPAFATVPRWFVKGRGLAMGIVVSGSSLGGVIWPIVLRRLLYKPSIGFGWAVRISAFIMLPLLLIACFTIRLPKTNKAQGHGKPDLSIVKNPVLIILACSLFFVYLGLFSPFFYITGWTIKLKLDVDMAFYMVSIINAASLFGRVIPGILADKMGPYNVMILSAGISGIICVTWTSAKSIGSIVVLSLAYGFASGAVIGLQGACAAAIAKPSQYGVAIGAVMAVVSIAGLIGSPINGQILASKGYLGVALFSGLSLIIGMVVLIPAKLKLNRNPMGKA